MLSVFLGHYATVSTIKTAGDKCDILILAFSTSGLVSDWKKGVLSEWGTIERSRTQKKTLYLSNCSDGR